MVDLFGKKRLEDRIQELESTLDRDMQKRVELERLLEKREEKIRKLTSDYQEANLALKEALKKTIASPPAMAVTEREEQKPRGSKLSPREMALLCKRLTLCRSPEDDLLTAILPDAAGLPPEGQELAKSISSARGWIVLQSPQLFTLFLIPPFPIQAACTTTGSAFQLESIFEMMETPVIVILAHAGDTFLGVALGKDGFEVQDRVESQVKEKHSKGGWSQKRFERLREEDIQNHVEAVMMRLTELQRKYGSVVRFAVLGGDASLSKQIAAVVDLPLVERRLERHDEKRLDRLLDEVYSFSLYRA